MCNVDEQLLGLGRFDNRWQLRWRDGRQIPVDFHQNPVELQRHLILFRNQFDYRQKQFSQGVQGFLAYCDPGRLGG